MQRSLRFFLVWSPVAATAATFVWLRVWGISASGLPGQEFDRVTIGVTLTAAALYLLGLLMFEKSVKEEPVWLAYTWVMAPCCAANAALSYFGQVNLATNASFVALLGGSLAGSIFLWRRTST